MRGASVGASDVPVSFTPPSSGRGAPSGSVLASGRTDPPSGRITGSASDVHVSVDSSHVAFDDVHAPARHEVKTPHGTSLQTSSSVTGRTSDVRSMNENARRATMQPW